GQSEPAPHSTMVKSSSLVLLVGRPLATPWAFPVSEKEGVCPDAVEGANCTEQCQTDGDCEENLKCCQTGCGWRSCLSPGPLCPRRCGAPGGGCAGRCTGPELGPRV
uniref:WAP domain-containing protein n=1 Tax=Chelydra serpentina TaxID=8475 RepID=A0A8C3SUK8_CHESE